MFIDLILKSWKYPNISDIVNYISVTYCSNSSCHWQELGRYLQICNLQINMTVKSSVLGPKSVIKTYFAPEVKFTFILPRLEEGEYLDNLEISVKMGYHFEVLLGIL